MPVTDILQMIGRAGRPQFDDKGKNSSKINIKSQVLLVYLLNNQRKISIENI